MFPPPCRRKSHNCPANPISLAPPFHCRRPSSSASRLSPPLPPSTLTRSRLGRFFSSSSSSFFFFPPSYSSSSPCFLLFPLNWNCVVWIYIYLVYQTVHYQLPGELLASSGPPSLNRPLCSPLLLLPPDQHSPASLNSLAYLPETTSSFTPHRIDQAGATGPIHPPCFQDPI